MHVVLNLGRFWDVPNGVLIEPTSTAGGTSNRVMLVASCSEATKARKLEIIAFRLPLLRTLKDILL